MATIEELLNAEEGNISPLDYIDPSVANIFEIDGEERSISIPSGEELFGVKSDKDVERKYFKCPKVVGDNIDLSQHQIYIAYVHVQSTTGNTFPDIGTGLYHCDDVQTDGDNITFSWLLSGNVFTEAGYVAFKVMAKKASTENPGQLSTKWNTTPAYGTVLNTLADGDEIQYQYPDVITQILDTLDQLQNEGVSDEKIAQAVSDYLEEHPITVTTDTTLTQKGVPADAYQTGVNIDSKLAKRGHTPDMLLGTSSEGVVEYKQPYTTLPNPHKLIFTGAVVDEYDGSEEVTVNIPSGSGGGEGGTSNYNELTNLPVINGVTVQGTKALSDYGIQPEGEYASGHKTWLNGNGQSILDILTPASDPGIYAYYNFSLPGYIEASSQPWALIVKARERLLIYTQEMLYFVKGQNNEWILDDVMRTYLGLGGSKDNTIETIVAKLNTKADRSNSWKDIDGGSILDAFVPNSDPGIYSCNNFTLPGYITAEKLGWGMVLVSRERMMIFTQDRMYSVRSNNDTWLTDQITWTSLGLEGGGGTPSDYETVKQNAREVWIDETLTYSIAENRDEIFTAVEDSKANKMTITDGSEYWDAEEAALYPDVLDMKKLRECRFYREMWLPNGLDITQSYRYAVDKNGQIRIYNIHDFAESFGGLSPWGIALKAEGQSFPSTPCHFICSAFRILGIDKTTGKWQLIKKARPIAALYTVAVTTEDDTVINVTRTELGNDMYSFAVNTPSNWTIDGDMCFHFFCQSEDAVTAEDVANYDKIMVVFRLKVQEEEHANKFTCSSGCDAYFSGSITEAFFGRFNGVTTELKEFISHNILENESSVLADNMPYLNELLTDESSDSSSGGDSYVLPIMTNDRLGGGRAVAKTTETVPVAVDDNGKLWIPDQSGGSSEGSSSPYDGKTIVMFGDSIVAGWGWQDGYGITKPLEEKYPNATWVNQAISGSDMAGNFQPAIGAKVKAYKGQADYILLEGGTNDNSNSVPLGTIAEGYDAQYDVTTFTGALESALQYIMDTYPLARKFFLIPHSFAKDNSYVDDYHDRAKEVCEKWNMPVLDMRNMSQIAMTNANKNTYTRNPNTNQGDGVHPTETWYRAFYSPVVDQFMRSLGVYDGDAEPPQNIPVTGVVLNQNTLRLTQSGQTQQLTYTVQPSNATNKSVTWESDHTEYVTVSQSGVVQAVANGTATITVKTVDGNKTDTCQVTVDIGSLPPVQEHIELSSLIVDKDCYFDTGLPPALDTNFEFKIKIDNIEDSGTQIFGVRDSEDKFGVSATNNLYFVRGALSSSALAIDYLPSQNYDITFSNDANVFTIRDSNNREESVTLGTVSYLAFDETMYMCNQNNNGVPYGDGFNGKFYYLKIFGGGGTRTVADIVPVKKSDGTLCLYDKVRETYLYNLGSGTPSEE